MRMILINLRQSIIVSQVQHFMYQFSCIFFKPQDLYSCLNNCLDTMTFPISCNVTFTILQMKATKIILSIIGVSSLIFSMNVFGVGSRISLCWFSDSLALFITCTALSLAHWLSFTFYLRRNKTPGLLLYISAPLWLAFEQDSRHKQHYVHHHSYSIWFLRLGNTFHIHVHLHILVFLHIVLQCVPFSDTWNMVMVPG